MKIWREAAIDHKRDASLPVYCKLVSPLSPTGYCCPSHGPNDQRSYFIIACFLPLAACLCSFLGPFVLPRFARVAGMSYDANYARHNLVMASASAIPKESAPSPCTRTSFSRWTDLMFFFLFCFVFQYEVKDILFLDQIKDALQYGKGMY